MLSCLGLKDSWHGSFLLWEKSFWTGIQYIAGKSRKRLGDYTKLIEIIHICVKTVCIISRKLFNYTNKKLSLNIYVIHGLNPGRQSPNYTNKKLSLNISVIHGFGSGRLSYDYTNFNSKLEGLRK